ncbi:MAG: dTDP-4-dehydrorhamnose 3,5-epimerase family protein [Patescibacteria group bacterium]
MKKGFKPYSKTVETYSDDRGVFVPFWEHPGGSQKPEIYQIKRVYYIYNFGKGVIRGFHLHKREWKYFIIASGAAKFIALNPKNPKDLYSFTSSARKSNLIVIPPGFANGWISLEEETILICCSTSTFKESLKDDVRYDPYSWGDVWGVKGR